jgi:membrane associated rhomboid family serine protease
VFIFLYRLNTPIKHTAWAVYGLMAINCLIFFITQSTSDIAYRYGFTPANHDFETIFTSMFLHGGWLHLLGNMFFLWVFGETVEDILGHFQTLACYLFCGIIGTLLHYIFAPHSTIPAIGASGAISGIIGLFMVLSPKAKMILMIFFWRFPVASIPVNAFVAGAIWLGEQLLLALLARMAGVSFGIAFMAHAGGLLAGVGLGLLLPRLGLTPNLNKIHALQSTKSMKCPNCQEQMPRREAGRYRCSGCLARFRVDDEGLVALTGPPSRKTWKQGGGLWTAFRGAFASREELQKMSKEIGIRYPTLARAVCIIGLIVAVGVVFGGLALMLLSARQEDEDRMVTLVKEVLHENTGQTVQSVRLSKAADGNYTGEARTATEVYEVKVTMKGSKAYVKWRPQRRRP